MKVTTSTTSTLSHYILSTNNTGTWANGSATAFTDEWSNSTFTLNGTYNYLVGWKFYVNDSNDEWNVSAVYSILTTQQASTGGGYGGGGMACVPNGICEPQLGENVISCYADCSQEEVEEEGPIIQNINDGFVDVPQVDITQPEPSYLQPDKMKLAFFMALGIVCLVGLMLLVHFYF